MIMKYFIERTKLKLEYTSTTGRCKTSVLLCGENRLTIPLGSRSSLGFKQNVW